MDLAPPEVNPFGGVLHVLLGFVLDVFRRLEIIQRNGSLVVEEFGALELYSREFCVSDGLAVIRKCGGHVRALQAEEELTFLHRVAEARVNLYHAASGNRDDRNASRDVRTDCSRYRQLSRRIMRHRRGQRELLRMSHLYEVPAGHGGGA